MAQENTVLIGDPYTNNECSNLLRSLLISLRKIDPHCSLFNISKKKNCENDIFCKIIINPHLTKKISCSINIFCIQLNHMREVYRQIEHQLPKNSYNILFPFFEEDDCFKNSVKYFNLFHEVWSYSKFHYSLLQKFYNKSITLLSFPAEVQIHYFLSRRYFNLPENSFLFLVFFDINLSFERQNLLATIKAYSNFVAKFPHADIQLIVKCNISKSYLIKKLSLFLKADSLLEKKIIFIDKNLSVNEEKNLIRHCDCFISLHRSISYARRMAEAMFLSKPVIATNYSGNLDFMNNKNSLLIDYQFIPIENQQNFNQSMWADPKIQQASEYMALIFLNQDLAHKIGKIANDSMRRQFSYRAMGLKYFNELYNSKNHCGCIYGW